MDVQERRDRIRRPAPQAAFGRQTKAVDMPACCLDSADRSFGTIREMDQAEIELRLRPQRQRREGKIILIIESLARDRKMNPIERPPDPR